MAVTVVVQNMGKKKRRKMYKKEKLMAGYGMDRIFL
jgi:hypothetical protein